MEAYPLHWPPSWPRTKSPENSRFGNCTIARGKKEIFLELGRMTAHDIIISTNLKLKIDGFPYSNQRQPNDRGVAVYFKLKGKPQCIPCDRWETVEDNMRAIAKTIDALRGIGRWGAEQMVDAAFTGFKALPAWKRDWWEVLGVPVNAHFEQADRAYKKLAMAHHPDHGGDSVKMAEINEAMKTFKSTIKLLHT